MKLYQYTIHKTYAFVVAGVEWERSAGDASIVAGPDGGVLTTKTGNTVTFLEFPTRDFDTEKLYGKNARPFIRFVGMYDIYDPLTNDEVKSFADQGYGVFVLGQSLYVSSYKVSQNEQKIWGYTYKQPLAVRRFVQMARGYGIKCIAYLHAPAYWEGQSWLVSLTWIEDFLTDYGLEGVFLDNANVAPPNTGSGSEWRQTLEFVQLLRGFVGPCGIIAHHCSVDPLGGYSGVTAVPINSLCDYTFVGETGMDTDDPNDLELRYRVAQKNISNAIGCYFPPTKGKRLSPHAAAIFSIENDMIFLDKDSIPEEMAWQKEMRDEYMVLYEAKRQEAGDE